MKTKLKISPKHVAIGVSSICTTIVLLRGMTLLPPPPKQMIKTSDYGIMVNKNNIRWMMKKNDCYYVCTKENGCFINVERDKHKVCKLDSPKSYKALEQLAYDD
jgi:hypothetical protein